MITNQTKNKVVYHECGICKDQLILTVEAWGEKTAYGFVCPECMREELEKAEYLESLMNSTR